MSEESIERTDRYSFSRIYYPKSEINTFKIANSILTTFIHKGDMELSLTSEKKSPEKFSLTSNQGFILAPGVRYSIKNFDELIAYSVSSKVNMDGGIIEIIDDGISKKENLFPDYKIIENPKKVLKPWGYELWISWFKDYHVLKQIFMNKGNQSSLQFHRKKLETNFLESGLAEIIEGYSLDPHSPEEKVLKSSKGINFERYKKRIIPGMHWTSYPGTIHRVIALEDYMAYEVSTPELDDIIRLEDDTQRKSGRINSEHLLGNLVGN